MSRPCCKKTVSELKSYDCFKPAGMPSSELEEITLTLDELESLRLSDVQGLYQEAAARAMGISRQTFGRIVESARHKTANAIVNGKALRIISGNVQVRKEGEEIMKIAVPTVGEMIDQHFGHCEKYSIFTIKDTSIQAEEVMASTKTCGCKSGIAGVLAQSGVNILIAGGIGAGAIKVLANNGIKTIRGATGTARSAVESFLRDELADNGEICHEHASDHTCEHN
jgi:predicted DNA-binding protein (UPF0251 family)/predicted Fe-Mo cluster-binding NifX family protein